MTKTRIYVDSVLDRDYVRVLISTDGKTETAIIMEKKALEKLLKGQKELWKKFKVRDIAAKRTKTEERLIRKIEGEVVTFPESETPFFEKLVKDFRRPPKLKDESQVRRVKVDRIKVGLRIPTRSRVKRGRKNLFMRQGELVKRQRVPRRRDPQRRRVDR